MNEGPGSWPPPGPPSGPPASYPASYPAPPASGPPSAGDAPGFGPALRDALTSLSTVIAWFAVAAVLGAVVWWQVTPLAEFTRTPNGAGMDEEQLSKQFATDGWFWVVASAGGLLSGLVLPLLRRRNPILMVLLVLAGGAFATFVMLRVGLLLGPSAPGSVMPSTPVGGKIPLQLKPEAHGVWFAWPIGALVGAIFALWIAEARDAGQSRFTAYGSGGSQPGLQNGQ